MKKAILFLHGLGGCGAEAGFFEQYFPGQDVIGLDYQCSTPWDAKREIGAYADGLARTYDSVSVIAVSIGAHYALNALADRKIEKALFISPVVDMERLILDMMSWENVTEDELREKKVIQTKMGEPLSWEYLTYVREHPVEWKIPTHLLYGEKDDLFTLETMQKFAAKTGATLTVMPGGEHWFHTEEQLRFLDEWLVKYGQ